MSNGPIIYAARLVREAIENEGPEPRYHRRMIAKHRHEWPTLWAALDELMEAVASRLTTQNLHLEAEVARLREGIQQHRHDMAADMGETENTVPADHRLWSLLDP